MTTALPDWERGAATARGILGNVMARTPVHESPTLERRQPRDEHVNCGTQSAHISMIQRRTCTGAAAFPVGRDQRNDLDLRRE